MFSFSLSLSLSLSLFLPSNFQPSISFSLVIFRERISPKIMRRNALSMPSFSKDYSTKSIYTTLAKLTRGHMRFLPSCPLLFPRPHRIRLPSPNPTFLIMNQRTTWPLNPRLLMAASHRSSMRPWRMLKRSRKISMKKQVSLCLQVLFHLGKGVPFIC